MTRLGNADMDMEVLYPDTALRCEDRDEQIVMLMRRQQGDRGGGPATGAISVRVQAAVLKVPEDLHEGVIEGRCEGVLDGMYGTPRSKKTCVDGMRIERHIHLSSALPG